MVAGSPPATHVARLGLMKDAEPYDLMTDRRVEDPAGQMLADVEAGKIDAALLWGPIGGPLVKQAHPGLKATPLLKEQGPPRLVFRITMGVRAGEDEWKRELNSQIRRNQDGHRRDPARRGRADPRRLRQGREAGRLRASRRKVRDCSHSSTLRQKYERARFHGLMNFL